MRRLDFDKVNELVLDAYFEKLPLNTLLQNIYTLTNLPMICFDTTFKTVSHCFERPFYIADWEKIAQNEMAQEETVIERGYLDILEKIDNDGSILVNTAGKEEYKTALSAVIGDFGRLAYMATIVEDVCSDDVIRLNDILTNWIKTSKANPRENSEPASMKQTGEFLLMEKPITPILFNNFGLDCPPPYYIAVLRSHNSGDATASYLRGLFATNTSFSIGEEKNDVVILFSGQELSHIVPKLESATKKYGYVAGISDRFDDLSRIGLRKRQARLTLFIGGEFKKNDTVHLFIDNYLATLCYTALKRDGEIVCQRNELEALRHKGLDDKHFTTLSAFLIHFQKSSSVATKLNIHKNSVSYRINNVEELLGCSLETRGLHEELIMAICVERLVSSKYMADMEAL